MRKELKIRPGFTPQEDVRKFRGTRQQDMDKRALPAGHILGWVAPSAASKPKAKTSTASSSAELGSVPATKSAKKNAKKKEDKLKALEDKIRESWEDDDDTGVVPFKKGKQSAAKPDSAGKDVEPAAAGGDAASTTTKGKQKADEDGLVEDLEKLKV